jgi:hypothetical protein
MPDMPDDRFRQHEEIMKSLTACINESVRMQDYVPIVSMTSDTATPPSCCTSCTRGFNTCLSSLATLDVCFINTPPVLRAFPGSATLQRGFWSRAGARRSQGEALAKDLRNGHLVSRLRSTFTGIRARA